MRKASRGGQRDRVFCKFKSSLELRILFDSTFCLFYIIQRFIFSICVQSQMHLFIRARKPFYIVSVCKVCSFSLITLLREVPIYFILFFAEGIVCIGSFRYFLIGVGSLCESLVARRVGIFLFLSTRQYALLSIPFSSLSCLQRLILGIFQKILRVWETRNEMTVRMSQPDSLLVDCRIQDPITVLYIHVLYSLLSSLANKQECNKYFLGRERR